MLAIDSATESLLIMNPYFLPDPGATIALKKAVERGVRVRVMTPTLEATDNPLVLHAMMRGLPELLEAGVEVYGYDRTLLHQKVVTVDGRWSIIGSCNFDSRSFDINDEVSVSIFDEAFAAQLEEAFEADLPLCVKHSTEKLRQRSVTARVADRLAWGLRGQL